MSLEKVRKLKTPTQPKELDDKDLAKALSEFEKSLGPFLKAVGTLDAALVTMFNCHTKLEDAIKKIYDDKSLDSKKKQAAKDVFTEVNKIKTALMSLP